MLSLYLRISSLRSSFISKYSLSPYRVSSKYPTHSLWFSIYSKTFSLFSILFLKNTIKLLELELLTNPFLTFIKRLLLFITSIWIMMSVI